MGKIGVGLKYNCRSMFDHKSFYDTPKGVSYQGQKIDVSQCLKSGGKINENERDAEDCTSCSNFLYHV